MVAPEEACENMRRLVAAGCAGPFGFYEASTTRLPACHAGRPGRGEVLHGPYQGMTMLSLAHVLLDRPMQKYFEADPAFQATTLLLQERIPKAVAPYVHTTGAGAVAHGRQRP